MQSQIAGARKWANELPTYDLENSDLQGMVDEYLNDGMLKIATINVAATRGRRRRVKGVSGQDYEVIDMTIPFDGAKQSLLIQPTSSLPIVGDLVAINDGNIVVSFSDNDAIDANVEKTCENLTMNLACLQADLTGFKEQARTTVNEILNARKAQLKEQRARDSRRRFPID